MLNTSIWPIYRTLSADTTPDQSSSITEASQSDCLESYLWHSLGEYYPSVKMNSVYSADPADWAYETLVPLL